MNLNSEISSGQYLTDFEQQLKENFLGSFQTGKEKRLFIHSPLIGVRT